MKRLVDGQVFGSATPGRPVPPPADGASFVVIANRLPVDRDTSVNPPAWKTSPGGLVTALEPVMARNNGAWIGWAGQPDEHIEPFDKDGMHLVPVTLTKQDVTTYYEGFSNATLWPLCHDVIVPPEYHRTWWDAYRSVNARFALTASRVAGAEATVWVHDYQLFMVPLLLRSLRPDLKIGFFNHIPFPPWELFSQLPWRKEILAGIQGADLIGFQRPTDAANFRSAVRVLFGTSTRGDELTVPSHDDLGVPAHMAVARHFPISVDTAALQEQATNPDIVARAKSIREDLGNPDILMVGVDRMDYTKGIRHRIKAFEELLKDKKLDPESVTLVQVATPSRERLEQYQQIRHDVELAVGRINGEFSGLGNQVVHYLHHSYPRNEMTALFLAADVCLVTALRDGMNLVAKEYVACRPDNTGALVLSEFTGAADQLTQAILVNPHDIDALKDGILRACNMPVKEQRRRMRLMRKRLERETVLAWSQGFLDALAQVTSDRPTPLPHDLETALAHVAGSQTLAVALDFDGVVAPLVDDPTRSVPLAGTVAEVAALMGLDRTRVALVSGRNLAGLRAVYKAPAGTYMYGSHGAETARVPAGNTQLRVQPPALSDDETRLLDQLDERAAQLEEEFAETGFWIERKPLGRGFHSRTVNSADKQRVEEAIDALIAQFPQARVVRGHDITELAVRKVTKGDAVTELLSTLNSTDSTDATGITDSTGSTDSTGIIYIGDDVTDEDAFAALADVPSAVTVKVGAGTTRASYRVDTPADVTHVLFSLRVARQRILAEQQRESQ